MASGRQQSARDRPLGASPLDAVMMRLPVPPRAWSLIVTIFGDVAAPRGGSLWLGTIQDILAPLGIDEGGVRTALSRLVADGWVERTRIGRNSYFSLTASAAAESRAAAVRIYGRPPAAHEGWTLAITREPGDAERLRRAAGWHAAGRIGTLLILPGRRRRPPPAQADVLCCETDPQGDALDRALAFAAWPLAALGEHYERFLGAFRPVAARSAGDVPASGQAATALRVLVVHELRRIVLRDPDLPAPVVGADWPGTHARMLAEQVWRACLPVSEAWLDTHARAASGMLPPPAEPFGWLGPGTGVIV